MRSGRATRRWYGQWGSLVTLAALIAFAVAGWPTATATAQSGAIVVNLAAGGGAPGASGKATVGLLNGTMAGRVAVNNLPAQPFGSGRFYGLWYVRNDDSKAFLGLLIRRESVIFSTGGVGVMRFSATQFTTGPAAGAPIAFGPAGTNELVVLIENLINGLTPSPVGPVPGSGVAVIGTF